MATTPVNAALQNHRAPPHRLPAFILLGAVTVVCLWFALGGYTRMKKPNPRWRLADGDTVEILAYGPLRDFTSAGHYGLSRIQLVRFRSALQDSTRDRLDIQAISDAVCPYAYRRGYAQIKIEAAPNNWVAALFHVSRSRWFRIDSAAGCHFEDVH